MTDLTSKLESVVSQAMANDTDPVTQSFSVARAIVKALPDMVQLLEWVECADGSHHTLCRQYELEKSRPGYWRLCRAATGGTSYIAHFTGDNALDAAKDAAQAHYTAQIMKALGVSDE